MPSHQTIIMARFLQLVKLFYDNIWRIKEIKEINRVKRKKKEGIKRQCKSTAVSNFMTNKTRKNTNFMIVTRKHALSIILHA